MSKIIVRFSAAQEAKAIPILFRHSPGTILPDRTYVINIEAARALKAAGVTFTEVGSEANAPTLEGAGSGERV